MVTTGLLLVCCSCVYLRLFKLNKQLAQFQEYVAIQTEPTLEIIFKKPVLKEKDLKWMTGFKPTSLNTTTNGVEKSYFFDKISTEGLVMPGDSLNFTFTINADRLIAQCRIPNKFNAFIRPEILKAIFEPAENADLSQSDTSSSWSFYDSIIKIPYIENMNKYLGSPSSILVTTNMINHIHAFKLRPPVKGAPGKFTQLDFHLDYNPTNRLLETATTAIGRLIISSEIGVDKTNVKIKRL